MAGSKKVMMAFTGITALVLVTSCKVEKTGPDTYRVVTPSTTAAKPAGEAAEENATEAGQKIKSGAKDLAQGVREGAHNVAESTRTAMESPTGQKVQAEAREIGAKVQVGVGKAAVAAGDALKDAGNKAQSSATDTTATRH